MLSRVFLGRIESSITISLDRELGSSILGRVGVEVDITIVEV